MLNQVVFTRCFPQRDLTNNGKVKRSDGFGVYSMSEELFADDRITNFDFLQQKLSANNGSSETSSTGLFNSYEYFAIAPERYGFIFEVSRPHCKIPRKNGKTHRTGTHIKQCLIGEIEGYPYEWFGADVWSAHLKTENEYYIDDDPNGSPELLPQLPVKPNVGYINVDSIRCFVNDGRKDTVKAAIWFLIQELEKPEGERRVLLIKDTPENVELWVASIECAFSEHLARTITFTTNRSKLGVQADNALFYYTDANGKFSQMQNRSVPQTRHPYCMIVGYHPKDTFCAALKPMATSNFALIDGVNKTYSFETDSSISKPYYNAAIQYGEDISDFCQVVLPNKAIMAHDNNEYCE